MLILDGRITHAPQTLKVNSVLFTFVSYSYERHGSGYWVVAGQENFTSAARRHHSSMCASRRTKRATRCNCRCQRTPSGDANIFESRRLLASHWSVGLCCRPRLAAHRPAIRPVCCQAYRGLRQGRIDIAARMKNDRRTDEAVVLVRVYSIDTSSRRSHTCPTARRSHLVSCMRRTRN